MRLIDVERRIATIRTCAGDYEGAHGMEDTRLEDFVDMIASGETVGCVSIARAIQKVREIEFPRYRA